MNARPEPTARTGLDARDDLLFVVDRWPALKARLMTSNGGAQTGMPGAVMTESPLVLDVNVSDLMFEVEENARHWAWMLLDDVPAQHGCRGACHGSPEHACAGHYCSTVSEQPNVTAERCPRVARPVTTSAMPALLEQVARRHGHFTADERMALEFSDTATDLREKVRKTLVPRDAPIYLGPCQGDNCAGELYVGNGCEAGKCRECSKPFTLAEQRVWLDGQLDARLMTATELTRALKVLGTPVPINTLKSWVERKRLIADTREPGMYRLADAQGLVTQRAARMRELAEARGARGEAA